MPVISGTGNREPGEPVPTRASARVCRSTPEGPSPGSRFPVPGGRRRIRRLAGVVALLSAVTAAAGEPAREPVLKQVDLPHSYYWRELYLPQLTTGPSSSNFLPDGTTLVYSMGGSLWRQRIGD